MADQQNQQVREEQAREGGEHVDDLDVGELFNENFLAGVRLEDLPEDVRVRAVEANRRAVQAEATMREAQAAAENILVRQRELQDQEAQLRTRLEDVRQRENALLEREAREEADEFVSPTDLRIQRSVRAARLHTYEPKFSGDKGNVGREVKLWVNGVLGTMVDRGIPKVDRVTASTEALSGTAREWWTMMDESLKARLRPSWEEFEAEILRYFTPKNYNSVTMKAWHQFTYQKKETGDQYINRYLRARLTLPVKVDDTAASAIFFHGLHPDWRRAVQMMGGDFETDLQELIDLLRIHEGNMAPVRSDLMDCSRAELEETLAAMRRQEELDRNFPGEDEEDNPYGEGSSSTVFRTQMQSGNRGGSSSGRGGRGGGSGRGGRGGSSQRPGGNNGHSGPPLCYKCNQPGHFARECNTDGQGGISQSMANTLANTLAEIKARMDEFDKSMKDLKGKD